MKCSRIYRFTLVLLPLLLCTAAARPTATTQQLPIISKGQFIEYRGRVGNSREIGLTLGHNGEVDGITGSYFLFPDGKDVPLNVHVDGRSIVLIANETNGSRAGRFVGHFPESDARIHLFHQEALQGEVINGTWIPGDGAKESSFDLIVTFEEETSRSGCRYLNAGFNNEGEVDAFASRIRRDIINGSMDDLIDASHFPLNASVGGRKRKIANAEGFRAMYPTIATEAFVNEIRSSCTRHLFSRDQGVSIGSGLIWMSLVKKEGKLVPAIIAINS